MWMDFVPRKFHLASLVLAPPPVSTPPLYEECSPDSVHLSFQTTDWLLNLFYIAGKLFPVASVCHSSVCWKDSE